jgi:tetratricopeptide (TPR) repeat protein
VQPVQAQVQPQQRGGPRKQDTPVLLIGTFRSDDRKLAVEASDAVRRRLQDEYSLRDLEVVTKNAVNQTLEASGYRPDSALSLNDLMELAKQLRGDYVIDGSAMKVTEGVRLDTRVLIRRGTVGSQVILSQPLPPATGKDVGAAAKDVEKNFTAVLKAMPLYKNCETALRAAKYDSAATYGRQVIAAYAPSTFGRLCKLSAFNKLKEALDTMSRRSASDSTRRVAFADSIIGVATEILASDSTSSIALGSEVDAYKTKGDNQAVIRYSLRLYRADPSNSAIAQSIVMSLGQSGAPDQALPILEELLKDNPADPNFLRTKWVLQLGAHRYKDAYVTAEDMLKADTSLATAEFFMRMSVEAARDSNTAKRTEYLARGVQKFPKNLDLQLGYADVLYRAGQLQQALEHARAALDIDPKSQNAYTIILVTQSQLKQPDSVLATSQKALAAGVSKETVGQVLLQVVAPVANNANTTKALADWEATLQAAKTVDAIVPTPASKFYLGWAAFQIGLDAVQQVQELDKQIRDPKTKAAQQRDLRAKACALTKSAEENWATAQINLVPGAQFQKDPVAQMMGAIQQVSASIPQMKTLFCTGK